MPPKSSFKYATSWFGNSFNGAPKLMQRQINGFYVAPDGTCYTNSGWDESGQDAGIYKDGDYLGRLPGIHDRVTLGGRALTGDAKYIFYSAQRVTKDKPDVRTWYVGRSFADANAHAAPWPGLSEHFLPIVEANKQATASGLAPGEIYALAVSEDELFVAMGDPDKVLVFDEETGKARREFPCPRPGAMIADKTGALWIVQRGEAPGDSLDTISSSLDFRIVQYSRDGKPTGKVIAAPGRPLGLALDATGALMVADDGPRQQIVIYDISGDSPRPIGAFGQEGGILTAPFGEFGSGPARLAYPCGVGIDSAGGIYVASRYPVTGCEIRKSSPDGKQLRRLYSNQFMNCADADPATDGNDVYSPRDCFIMDFSKSNGLEGRWIGHTVDKFRYPDDPRIHGEGGMGYAPLMRRLEGRLYMYLIAETGRVSIFKQVDGGKTFAPCGLYSTVRINRSVPANWPPAQPDKGRWLWIDKNGDGRIDRDEIEADGIEMDSGWSYWVDANGGIWHAKRTEVQHYPLQGIDKQGNPVYTLASGVSFPAPPEFASKDTSAKIIRSINRLQYQIDTDTMYLSGFTDGNYSAPSERGKVRVTAMGSEIFCYDQWSTPQRKLRWRAPISFNANDQTACCNGLSVAGNRVFVGAVGGGSTQNLIWVIDAATGNELGIITPGTEVGGIFGWMDTTHSMQAFRRKCGEILLFVEDVWKEKQVMYRLPPDFAK